MKDSKRKLNIKRLCTVCIILILIIVLIVVLVSCGKNKQAPTQQGSNNPGQSTVVTENLNETEAFNNQFSIYVNKSLSGNKTQDFLKKVKEVSQATNTNLKVDFENLSGQKASSDGTAGSLDAILSYVGNQFSVYEVTATNTDESGKITGFSINQTIGNNEDPVIPEAEKNNLELERIMFENSLAE